MKCSLSDLRPTIEPSTQRSKTARLSDGEKPVTPTSSLGGEPKTTSSQRVLKETGAADTTYRRILVPIDFSDHSKKTVSFVVKFLSTYNNATIQLLHVLDVLNYVGTPYVRRLQNCDHVKSEIDAAAQEARERLTEVERQFLGQGVKVKAYLRFGSPFEEIVQMADKLDVDLIIIGSHGCTGLTHLLVGSTAERVVEHAPCPVLVVKERRSRVGLVEAPRGMRRFAVLPERKFTTT
ncbi:MAG: universal stress protein [Verrucomicrobia bacterium]|nr:universal stress protein [Verrucomicrobiota bacterium]